MLKHRCISAALFALALAGCQGRGLQPQSTSAAIPATNPTIATVTSEPVASEAQSSTPATIIEETTTTTEVTPETVPVTSPRATVPATTARTAPPTTAAVDRSGGGAGGTLACIRSYEGDYGTNTGNGYYGAYQFDLPTWRSVGGSGLPSDASPAEQDMRAQMLLDSRGLAPWPTPARMCT